MNGDLDGKIYRVVLTSDSGDILGLKVTFGEPTIYVRLEDSVFSQTVRVRVSTVSR